MENRDQLIEKMKQMNIKPKPSWHFTAKGIFFWIVFIVSVILGALAFSIVLFSIQQTDFDLIAHMSHSRFEFILGLVPFFWIISLIIFLVTAMIGIKNSKKGYKFSYSSIVAFSASFSILLGTIFFIGGGAQWLENAFSVRVVLYEGVQEKKLNLWMQPEKGYLAGTIIQVNDNSFELNDFTNHNWAVNIEQANIASAVIIVEGEKIKIIGEIVSKDNFQAYEIRPWGGQGGKGRGRKPGVGRQK